MSTNSEIMDLVCRVEHCLRRGKPTLAALLKCFPNSHPVVQDFLRIAMVQRLDRAKLQECVRLLRYVNDEMSDYTDEGPAGQGWKSDELTKFFECVEKTLEGLKEEENEV